ncbi:MAG: response regulator [Pseudomonadota bacterium]
MPKPPISVKDGAVSNPAAQALQEELEEMRRRCAAAEAANEAKSLFLATMSHEIREPMNGVIGMTRLLLETPLSDEQHGYVEGVHDSGQALLTIINDILDLSQMEAGRLKLDGIDFELDKVVERVAAMMAVRAQEKGLGFKVRLPPHVPRHLHGDPGRLRQILVNLLGNAIKFTSEGRVALDVELIEDGESEVKLVVRVSDSGIGIPDHVQARLFTAYAQADPSVRRLYGGSGLGLTICKRLAGLMGGEIELHSQPGEGTRFDVSLVLGKAADESGPDQTGQDTASIAGLRLLIVDPNPTTRTTLEQQTMSWSAEPRGVSTGAEALKALEQSVGSAPFQIALVDRSLPDMSGEQLGEQIKADPRFSSTELIMVASSGLRGDAARVADIGFAAYLPKPLAATTLLECLLQLPAATGRRAGNGNGLITVHSMSERRAPSLSILLADDNPLNCRLAVLMLEKVGHAIDVVEDGAAALEAVRNKTYDLVLMDVQMPELDGLEATRRIRALPGDQAAVPVVAITANAMTGDDQRCLDAGMNDYITKPIDRARLLSTVDRWGHTRVS